MSEEADKRKPKRIDERTYEYALRAVRLHQALVKQKDRTANILGGQFLRAATSVGANVEEAQAGESRRDFIHKLTISQKETRESLYWLRLMRDSEVFPSAQLQPLIQETEEVKRILTAILVSSKRNHRPPNSDNS